MRGSVLGSCHRSAPARCGTYLLRQARGCEWQACRTSLPRTFCLVVTVIAQPHRSWAEERHKQDKGEMQAGTSKEKCFPQSPTRGQHKKQPKHERFLHFFLFFFAFLPNDFELNSSFWQSWPWYYTLKPDYAKATPTLQQRPCYDTC